MIGSMFSPSSIAVVGVSTDPHKVGHQIFANLLSYPHPIYPIHPSHGHILGKKAYASVLLVPEKIDLVIIATPQPTVEGIVHECIDKKVRAICIISAGFAETSKEGKKIQDRIATKLAQNHILLLGPNTLGIINPYELLNASFAPNFVQKGHIALISQSGAMLTTLFSEFSSRSVGCSFAISLGNGAGITVNDALEYALHDTHTKVIALYLESIPSILEGSPSFFTLCKKISRQKPIVFLKGGRTEEGQKASLSHTAALATNSVLLKEAQYQSGYTMVETIEQFFETTFFLDRLLSRKNPTLPGSVLVLTNAGGPGVNAIDVASWHNVDLASWSRSSLERFAREIPRVHPSNPTDLLGDASVEDIEKALLFAEDDPLIESVLLIITPQAVTDIPGIVRMLIHHSTDTTLPLIVALMGGDQLHTHRQNLRTHGITTVEYANEGIEIFSTIQRAKKSQLVDRSAEIMKKLEANFEELQDTSRSSQPLASEKLEEVLLLLEKYGLTLPRCAIVASAEQLDELDALDPTRVYPLIAKTTNLQLKHKAVVGAVVKDIQSKSQALSAFHTLQRFGDRIILQEVIEDALEVIIGFHQDPQFGTFLAVGAGGSLTNIIADRAYLFLPATQREVRACFKRTKLFSLLTPEQKSLILVTIEKITRLANEHPEIQELEINPLMVTKHQAYVADIKVERKKVKK